ncbi:iron-sulfur cluster assembly scaffold protein [Desulfobacter vibrioformis]|uniref:iron-sulfur cluster assembly scaffold protein n=1 Tax=Desulfobacter vibrioformis TaxID=34031 RepID=UPI001FE0D117|nr:iron-sulfur cluster assembly scaffold protein [Desulfobacter vibrioformis]
MMESQDQDFWNVHSLTLIEMAYEAGSRERLENPDGYGTRTGVCGDSVEFFIMVDHNNCLSNISFDFNGCIYTAACCNTVVCLAQGHSIDNVWNITADMVADYLQTLPEDHYHCAELCVGGFYQALVDYQSKKSIKKD